MEHKSANKWAILYVHAVFHLIISFINYTFQTGFHPPRCRQPSQRHLLSLTDTLVSASAFTQNVTTHIMRLLAANVTHLCLAFCPLFAVASVLAAPIGSLWTGPKVLCGLNASHGSLFTVAN